jgi:hypothetical protein
MPVDQLTSILLSTNRKLWNYRLAYYRLVYKTASRRLQIGHWSTISFDSDSMPAGALFYNRALSSIRPAVMEWK